MHVVQTTPACHFSHVNFVQLCDSEYWILNTECEHYHSPGMHNMRTALLAHLQFVTALFLAGQRDKCFCFVQTKTEKCFPILLWHISPISGIYLAVCEQELFIIFSLRCWKVCVTFLWPLPFLLGLMTYPALCGLLLINTLLRISIPTNGHYMIDRRLDGQNEKQPKSENTFCLTACANCNYVFTLLMLL